MPRDVYTISDLLDAAWFEGAASEAQSVPWPYPVAIGGHRYAVDWKFYGRGLVDALRNASDTSALPGEASLNPGAAWKRNRDDWTLGAGQVWADRALEPYNVRIELEPRQFLTSKGVDPWTLGQLKLHPDTELLLPDATAGIQVFIVGTRFYRITGPNMQWTSDPSAAAVTWTNVTGISGTINDVTNDGQHVYIATTTGIYMHDASTNTAAALAAPAATQVLTLIRWVSGWLLGANGPTIYEIKPSGVVNTVFTHPNTSFIWASIAASPGAIYLGGQALDGNQIYSLNVTQAGALSVPIHAMSLPFGEWLRHMRYYGTYMVLGTSKGIRVAAIGNNSVLVLSPVIPTGADVGCMWAEAQYIWFGWTNYDAGSTGLGRLDLSVSSDQNSFVPAYASDLMYTGQGPVTSMARFGGKTYFCVSGVGIARQERTGKYVPSGTFSQGRLRFGTYEPKAFLGVEIRTDPLNGAIAVNLNMDDASTASLGRLDQPGTTGRDTIIGSSSIPATHDWYEPVLTITPTANFLQSPVIRRLTFRAIPVPMPVEQIIVPIMMSDVVRLNTGEGQDFPMDTDAEYAYLKSLAANGSPVIYQEGRSEYLVIVRGVEWIDQQIKGMNAQRQGLQGILGVTLLTQGW